MANLRRGGSASLFFIEGDLPSLQAPDFGAALERQRFRSIETAASEEVSIGWVTCNDPSGESFVREASVPRAGTPRVRRLRRRPRQGLR